MEILAIDLERVSGDQTFCGLLSYLHSNGQQGTLFWTVTCVSPLKTDIAFVHGDHPNWLELTRDYVHRFSDQILTLIAHRHQRPTLIDRASLPV